MVLIVAAIATALCALGAAVGAPVDAGTAPVRTLAVMDFDNRSPSGEWSWLGKGLADMLITDLAGSRQLVIVEREKLHDLTRELDLGQKGLVDRTTAARVGQLAAVDWVLFGSYLKEGDDLKVEAHLLDLKTQQLLRVEWVEGRAAEVFKLEKSLVRQLLERLHVPLTEAERRSIEYVPTDSIPAFEHYSRSLSAFDAGEWHGALLECRLAVKADRGFLKAAARLADVYAQLGEPEHALVEYRRLISADTENVLPEPVYYKMGRVLEDLPQGEREATVVYRKIVDRHPEYGRPFDIRTPSRPSRGWEDVGGSSGYRAVAAAHDVSLRALERLALIHRQAGEEDEAVRRYSQIVHFCWTHGMGLGAGAPYGGLHDRVWGAYQGLYYQRVRESRDAALYPPVSLVVLSPEGGTFGAKTEPTHGFYKYAPMWLAPPGKEIARVSVSLDGELSADGPQGKAGSVQVFEPGVGFTGGHWWRLKFDPAAGRSTVDLDLKPGIRILKMDTFVSAPCKVTFTLRPWSGMSAVPSRGGFSLIFDPEEAQALYVDGKKRPYKPHGNVTVTEVPAGDHVVEVVWPDGRRASKKFHLKPLGNVTIFLSAEKRLLSRQVLPGSGSHTYLFTDRDGKVWLLWDQAVDAHWSMNPSQESDLFCATSVDGVEWTNPARLTVSSEALDAQPVLQQDRLGTYHLIWSSNRDPEDRNRLWTSSSADGRKWSFPRKVVLPVSDPQDLARWRESRIGRFAFAIDRRNTHWLIWQGRLFQSGDGAKWTEAEVLKTTGKPDNLWFAKEYSLTHDLSNRHLVVTSKGLSISLWRREREGEWVDEGMACEDQGQCGAVAVNQDGTVACAYARNGGVFLRTHDQRQGWSENLLVESYLKNPFHPSIAALPDGRFVVAFGSKDGIVACVCEAPLVPAGGDGG